MAVRCALSYQLMDMNNLPAITKAISEDFDYYPTLGYNFTMGISDILNGYAEEAEKLTRILWILQTP